MIYGILNIGDLVYWFVEHPLNSDESTTEIGIVMDVEEHHHHASRIITVFDSITLRPFFRHELYELH